MNKDVIKLLKDRYFILNEKKWEDLVERISSLYKPIKDNILNMEFIPSSPTLMNANTNGERKGTLSSCFPMNIDDSMEEIMDSMKEVALVTKSCGGVGLDFSTLRSKNEMVKSSGKKSGGAIPFIQIFNSVLDNCSQGGARKGAGMSLLSVYHPDILDFIDIKNDLSTLNRVNMSIKIDNVFYEKLNKNPNKLFKTKNIVDKKENVLIDSIGNKYTYKMIWDKIIDSAWNMAEPGIINEDYILERSTLQHIDQKGLTNPCLMNNALLLTVNGIKKLKDINIGDLIWSKEGWTKIVNKWYTGNKDVYRYETTAGNFESTDNHEVVNDGEKIEIKNTNHLEIIISDYENITDVSDNDIMDGLMIGDGCRNKHPQKIDTYLIVGKNDHDYFKSRISHLIDGVTYKSEPNNYKVITSITKEELVHLPKRKIPDRFFYGDKKKKIGFLIGLYSANGFTCGKRITLKSTSKELILQTQLMLNSLGIYSYYTTNKPYMCKWNNGEYISKQSYDLNVSEIEKFNSIIPFLQEYKNDKIKNIISTKTKTRTKKNEFDIKNIEYLGKHNVYDITVDNSSHTFWCNGFDVSNCSEFVSSVPYTSCNLGSIDVSKFINKNNTNFDYKKLNLIVRNSVRYLNAVIDNNTYPLDKIRDVSHNSRPIGLGIMGFAHALYKMKIKYDSDLAKEKAEDIMKFFTLVGMDESCIIARETTKPFRWYDENIFFKANKRLFKNYNSFCDKIGDIINTDLINDIKEYGIYNSSITSIAPTGCATKNTRIKTTEGIKSLKEIFKENDIDIEQHKNNKNKWFVPIKPLSVETVDGPNRITKLYINGKSDTINVTTTNNNSIEATGNHKILVKENNKITWKRLDELKIGDKILIKKCVQFIEEN